MPMAKAPWPRLRVTQVETAFESRGEKYYKGEGLPLVPFTKTSPPTGRVDRHTDEEATTKGWVLYHKQGGVFVLFLISAYYGTKTNNFILALTWNKSYFASWDRESSVEKLISSSQILSYFVEGEME